MGSSQAPQRKKDKHRYQFGQHSCYYGYHGFYGDGWEGRVGPEDDPRLRLLEADWFRDKKVLDVGCGTGHVTLAIARQFNPSHILGVELDERLVHAAKQNIRHFLSHDLVVAERNRLNSEAASSSPSRKTGVDGGRTEEEEEKEGMQVADAVQEIQQALALLPSFPLSLRVSRGPLSAPPLLLPPSSSSSRFPNNITFIQVSESSRLLSEPTPLLKLLLSAGQLRVSAAHLARPGPLPRHPLPRLDQVAPPAVGRRGRGPTVQPGLSEPVARWAVHPSSTTMEPLQPQQERIGDRAHASLV